MGSLLLGALVAFATSADVDASSSVIAQLGPATVTHSDVEAALLTKSALERSGVLGDPKAIGNMLDTLLVRRAVVAQASDLLDASEIESAKEQGRHTALAELAVRDLVERAVDARALEEKAYELFQQSEPAASEKLSLSIATFRLDERWRDARNNAARVVKQLQAGELDFDAWVQTVSADEVVYNEFPDLRPGALDPNIRTAVSKLQPGEIAGPIPGPVGYQIVRLDQRKVFEAPTFSQSRERWLGEAEPLLRQATRSQIESELDQSALVQHAIENDLAAAPVAAAFVRQSAEEAVLRQYRERYLGLNGPQSVEQLARETYLTQPERYRTPSKADIALAQLPAFPDEEARAEIEKAVKTGGLREFQGALEATGLDVLQFIARGEVPLRVMDEPFTSSLEMMGSREQAVGYIAHQGINYAMALANYQPEKQKTFEMVKSEIEESLTNSLFQRVWEAHVENFRKLELTVDPDAVAALRNG